MAIIYYPNSSFILQRTTSGSVYTEIVTSTVPNSIFFFDSASQLAAISASTLSTTASWAISASWAPGGQAAASVSASWASSSLSSSYSLTASYAVNGGTGGSSVSASWASSSLTASSIYVPSGSGAWRMYVDTSGDLVFNFA